MRVIARNIVLAALLVMALQTPPISAKVEGYDRILPSLALIGYPTGDPQLPISFGTGFAVMSASHPPKSYFVTNDHVVTDALGKPAAGLFAVLPREPAVRHQATIVRRNPDLDVAIVSIDVGDVGVASITSHVPSMGDDIAIAGFPYSEVCGLAAMCGAARAVPNGHKGQLRPAGSHGSVSQSQLGEYSIVYAASVQQGNSGGPLFDAHSGVVFGIVVEALPGFGDAKLPAQTEANRAISFSVAMSFVNKSPVTIAAGSADGGDPGIGVAREILGPASTSATPPRRPPPFCSSQQQFERAYGEWLQAHGLLKSIARHVNAHAQSANAASFAPAFKRIRARQTASYATMQAATAGLRRREAAQIADEAEPLVAAVGGSMPADAALAASPRSAAALETANAAEGSVRAAAQSPNLQLYFSIDQTCRRPL